MKLIFWMVHGDAATDSIGGFSDGWGDIYGDGYGDGWGDRYGDGGGNGGGNGGGYGGGNGDGWDDGEGRKSYTRIPALVAPRTLEAHAAMLHALGRLP